MDLATDGFADRPWHSNACALGRSHAGRIRGQSVGHRGWLTHSFARSYSLTATASNQDMLTAVFRAVVERFKLQGERLGDGGRRRGDQALQGLQPGARERAVEWVDPHTPGLDMQRASARAGSPNDIGNKIRARTDRRRSRRGTDSISDARSSTRGAYQQLLLASYRGRNAWQRCRRGWVCGPGTSAGAARGRRARTGLSWGRAPRSWQALADHTAEQDQLAQQSHMKAGGPAWRAGFYDDLVVGVSD